MALDGKIQKLVYNNYNKFITATETMQEMKTLFSAWMMTWSLSG
jgi:hypothetical protein